MTQSSLLRSALPASLSCLLWAAIAPPAHLDAQTELRLRVVKKENFRQQPSPDARLLGTVFEGIELSAERSQGGWTEVVLEGFIWAASVGRTDRDGFDLVVTASGGENLRATPNGPVLARLAAGFLLEELGREGAWVRVRRKGWMWSRSLEPVRASGDAPHSARVGQASGEKPPARDASGGDSQPDLGRGVTLGRIQLRSVPDGPGIGTLEEGAPVRVLTRSGEWVRVASEGWVREADLRPAAGGVLVGVTGAEVRSNPPAFEGKLVQWTVQYVALQTADELRREIPAGQRYMLARGPLPEAGFVYVILNPQQVAELERLRPLAELVIIARVKVARSQFLGNPVLELIDLSVRRP